MKNFKPKVQNVNVNPTLACQEINRITLKSNKYSIVKQTLLSDKLYKDSRIKHTVRISKEWSSRLQSTNPLSSQRQSSINISSQTQSPWI